jgi:hypothetical protein
MANRRFCGLFHFQGYTMESISSESSAPASVEAPSATPAPVADSTPAADAIQQAGTVPGQPATDQIQGDETVIANQDEFPDEQAFVQLPGEQRAENWKRARSRIGEQNERIEQLAALEPFKPAIETIEQMGGWDSVEPLLQLATNLFAPVVGEDGQQVFDQSGLPQYTAAPFVERLAEQSLGTLDEILLKAFDIPYGQETLGHKLFRERLGLDPNLLETYQKIQSPDQARELITQSGGIDPALFEGVNPEYHDSLRSLMSTRPGLKAEWAYMSDEAKSELLEDRKEQLENRKYAEEQRRRDEESAKERGLEAKRRIETAGQQSMTEAQDRVVNAQFAKLKQTATFFADEGDNTDVWEDIISRSANDLQKDPALKKASSECSAWHYRLAEYEAAGDRLKASQARVEIGKLERKLEKAFGDRVTERAGQWSRRLGGARAVQQQQIQDAKPRIEIGSAGDNSTGNPPPAYSPPPTGMRFGMSEERKQQLAADLRARRQAMGG